MITKIDRMNGYLGFTRVHGETRYNDPKNDEIKDRVSM
jgi:ribonucleoside-triphosphate reductase